MKPGAKLDLINTYKFVIQFSLIAPTSRGISPEENTPILKDSEIQV